MKKKVKEALGNLSSKVTTADKITEKVWKWEENYKIGMVVPEWIKEIETYCDEMGILPADLIETHKQSLKMARKAAKNDKKDHSTTPEPEKPTKSNFRRDLIEKKTGYKA